MIKAIHDPIKKAFRQSWILCLDESIPVLMAKCTCPGCTFAPMNLHQFGNDYHTYMREESWIIYTIELIEGRSWLQLK